MTFSMPVTRREPVVDKLRGFGKDDREVLVYRPERDADWIAESAPTLTELLKPQTRLVHVFKTKASEPYGFTSMEGYVAQMAEKSFNTMRDMDPLTNDLHMAVSPEVVVVAAGETRFDAPKETLGRSMADSVARIVARAGKELNKEQIRDWMPALHFCTEQAQDIIKALAPISDTSAPVAVTLTTHRNNGQGHSFEPLDAHDFMHAMLTLEGGLHHAISWSGTREDRNVGINEYFQTLSGLTVRDSSKPTYMTFAYAPARTVILNVQTAKQKLLPA